MSKYFTIKTVNITSNLARNEFFYLEFYKYPYIFSSFCHSQIWIELVIRFHFVDNSASNLPFPFYFEQVNIFFFAPKKQNINLQWVVSFVPKERAQDPFSFHTPRRERVLLSSGLWTMPKEMVIPRELSRTSSMILDVVHLSP